MVDVNEIFEYMEIMRKHAPTKKEKTLIKKAYAFAEKAHENQKRNSGEPYFHHVFAAGTNCARFGMGSITISAAILHDTIEDTDTTEEDIRKEFGDDIAFLVSGVTKLGKLKYQGRERHIESLRKFFIASAEDLRVVIIKLADRLHNIQTLQYVREDKQHRIALETIEIYAPLAWRLGMARLATELQEYAFPFAYPKEFTLTEKLLKQKKQTSQKYIEKVYKSLRKEIATQGIKNIQTEYRIKSKYSLWRKLIKKNMDIEKIYDIIALRVIVKSVEDCYRILGLIHTMWKPLPGRIKDYIAVPKPNRYQSLHTTIFTGDGGIAEIQIRSEEMHEIAEYGIASHVLYKGNRLDSTLFSSIGQNREEAFEWVKQLSEFPDKPAEFVKDLKTDFFTDRIFVFTPQGDVVDLPDGSSVIDFAYAIHSDIGNHASGAKINGKYVALKTQLLSGNIVEVETKESSHPSSKWMDYTKTALARRHIQRYIKDNSLFNKFFGR